jgi:DNA-binding NarL/FixJ family response regulator
MIVIADKQRNVHSNMIEPNDGQPERAKPKRHNAKLCPFVTRQRIINALANGDSIRSIARATHVSTNTVAQIRDQEWQQVETRKTRLAAQWEQVATSCEPAQ